MVEPFRPQSGALGGFLETLSPILATRRSLRVTAKLWNANGHHPEPDQSSWADVRSTWEPRQGAGQPTMFICGNDEAAKKTVTQILDQFGWETADMGQVEAARAIEPLCMLWCIPGFLRNEWAHAFKLLRE